MKKIFYLSVIGLLTIAACKQTSGEKQDVTTDAAVEKPLLEKRVNDLNDALLSANRDSLNSLTSDELSYGHSNGDMQTKSGFVDSLATKNWAFTKLMATDKSIVSIDGNTAIVREKLFGTAKNVGKDTAKIALGVLQVWKKENGKWLLYGRQGFKLLPPNDVPPAK